MKYILRNTEKFFAKGEVDQSHINDCSLSELIEAGLAAVASTNRDKVIKVFNVSLNLFNALISCQRLENDHKALKNMISILHTDEIIQRFLIHSEQSNTRVTNKIHESLLDMSY